MYDYYIEENLPGSSFATTLKPLYLSGLFFGLGVACKWYTLYGLPGLILLIVLAKYGQYKGLVKYRNKKSLKQYSWSKVGPLLNIRRTSLYSILFFIVVPGVIYLAAYLPFMMVKGSGHGLFDVFYRQFSMLKSQTTVDIPYECVSPWWSWPLVLVPCNFSNYSGLPGGKVSVIFSMGNPAIWWLMIPAAIAAMVIAIKKRDQKLLFLLIAFSFQYFPWALVSRATYIYHFISVMPLGILLIVAVIKYIDDRYPKAKFAINTYFIIVIFLFFMFYPVLSGMAVNPSYIKDHLIWFKSWQFLNHC